MPDSLFLSLVVPTYNEADNIRDVLKTLVAVLDPVCLEGYEILVVDDDSPDRTWAIAEDVARVLPQVRVCRRCGERGLATAVIHGWQQAHGTVVGVIDGDLQHPPEVLGELLERMREGADLAVASRNIEGGGVNINKTFKGQHLTERRALRASGLHLNGQRCRGRNDLNRLLGYFGDDDLAGAADLNAVCHHAGAV